MSTAFDLYLLQASERLACVRTLEAERSQLS